MNKFLYILLATITLSSCSEYHKAIKSDDVEFKTKVFTQQIEKKKYSKAIRLFEQYASSYRGKPQAESALLDHGQPLAGLQRRRSARGESVLGLFDCVERRYGQTEVALPVHAA